VLEFAGINYLAVFVVWVIYMAVGAYWYSTAGFAKQWTKHTGVDILKIPQQRATEILGYIVASCLLQVFTLAVVLRTMDINTLWNGVAVGIFLWLGFTAATTVGVTLYAKKSWKFLWLNSSYFLVVMVVGSAILAVWQ
jgi:hypothetical protein